MGSLMTVQDQITGKLNATFTPAHLEVINESNQHNVPPGSESHFKVVLVSDEFEKMNRVQRHRAMHRTLATELQNQIHALTMHLYTTAEWAELHGAVPESPQCRGGSKHNS